MSENIGKSAIDSVADQARATADRLADRATDAISSTKTAIHQTLDNAADRANAATQWASDKVNSAKQAPSDLVEAGADYIRARPYVAVGIGLALGYLIGKVR